MILRAPWVVTMQGEPIRDGVVSIDAQGEITAVGPYRGEAVTLDLGTEGYTVLMPGLINAHCHLDYTMMRGAIPPPDSFTAWVREINRLKSSWQPGDFTAAIADGFRELRRWGTTSVCNIEAFPELLPELPPAPLRTWWMAEMIDLRMSPEAAPKRVCEMLAKLESRQADGGIGLSPHAPYTASEALYRATNAVPGVLKTTHLAESRDEDELFRTGEGNFARLLAGAGRPLDDCGHGSPFARMVRAGLVGPGWLLVHANIGADDLLLLRERAEEGRWYFVHCPGSHAYFRHPPFPWEGLAAAGAQILLGTDSLASNQELNLFAELQMAQRAFPGLTSEALLRTVTITPAEALGQAGRLGVIAPGAAADLIALALPMNCEADLYSMIIANRNPVPWMMIQGNLIA